MTGRHLGGFASTAAPLSAATDANGVATFTIPAGRLRRYSGAMATVVAPTSAGLFAYQITAQPAAGADLSAVAGTVTVQVSRSASTLVLGTGLTAAGAGITVLLLPLGI